MNLAVGYGGRREIADAVRSLLAEHSERGTTLDELVDALQVEHIAEHLYTRGQPDPDLVIRTSGEQRMSGFLLWRGHAAAARSSGAEPGVMGAGLYLVWPAFYTDVTDSYRLGRAGRIRTDLGGLYFNAIVVVLTFVWWWATGWEALLLLVAT